MEKMLINATHPEEIRVALVKEQYLFDLDIEKTTDVKKKANIYKGRVTRIEPSLEAAFIEYGANRQGFLPLKEIAPEYFSKATQTDANERPNIKDLIKEGQELMVQVDKEERGTKGAALTTYITLAGCYLVLMPNNPRSGGISRRIEGDEREELKETMRQLSVDEGMGLIVRTAGIGKNVEDLELDLEVLKNQWKAINEAYKKQPAPFLIYQEGDVVIRSIRDNLRKSVTEIIIDDATAFIKAKNYIEQIKPDFVKHLKLYNDTIPLFNRYHIESQIETAYKREVVLPSGGSLVIDRTEALVSIDINSAKATTGADIETTAYNTNLEAADEIARQLRLRDLGGLIVIDFIDMSSSKNQRDVETRLKDAMRSDRARVQVGRISRFGLLEMSRQRLRLSLGEKIQNVCPRCHGRGVVRSVPSHALSLLRLIEEEALKNDTQEIQVQLPVETASFISNEKRLDILQIEKRHDVNILIIPNPYIESPNYEISGLKGSAHRKRASYELINNPELEVIRAEAHRTNRDDPAIKELPLPQRSSAEQVSFIKRLWSSLFGFSDEASENKEPAKSHSSHRQTQDYQERKGQRRRRPSHRSGTQSGGGRRHHHSQQKNRTSRDAEQGKAEHHSRSKAHHNKRRRPSKSSSSEGNKPNNKQEAQS